MGKGSYLGELEQMVLWSVLRLDGKGYGASVLRELDSAVNRKLSTGALYSTLDRLEKKGMLQSEVADPEPGRGGRPKRLLTVTAEGREALARAKQEWMTVWAGVDPRVASHGHGA